MVGNRIAPRRLGRGPSGRQLEKVGWGILAKDSGSGICAIRCGPGILIGQCVPGRRVLERQPECRRGPQVRQPRTSNGLGCLQQILGNGEKGEAFSAKPNISLTRYICK